MNHRGIYEREAGSGVWICYFDKFGKRHRERPGAASVALKLYRKRKQHVLEGKKLFESFRKPSVNFRRAGVRSGTRSLT